MLIEREAVLRAFDEQVRRDRVTDGAGELVELDEHVLRRIPPAGGWTGITWSRLGAEQADGLIDAQIERFAALARGWEWKHYSWDTPADLPERLLARGFNAGDPEALLFAPLAERTSEQRAPAGVEIVRVAGAEGIAEMVEVHDAVFGGDNAELGRALLAALERTPPSSAAFLARADGRAVAAGRVEAYPETEFASLWGGATLPGWRKRGIFRALVAARASFARKRGARYLHADALPTSQPILERLGFERLATTTPFTYRPGAPTPRRA